MNITISTYWRKIQASLFPGFAEELGPTTEKHQKVILILERVNSNLKDDYGARYVRVRCATKILANI